MFLTFGNGDEKIAVEDRAIKVLKINDAGISFKVQAFVGDKYFNLKSFDKLEDAEEYLDFIAKDINAGRVQDIVEDKIKEMIKQWAENDERSARDEND